MRSDLAMTGEITLRGRVLPIGGLKEKSLAAHRVGIHTILFPIDNLRDLEEIPEEIKKSLKMIPVAHMDEVLKVALVEDVKTKNIKKAGVKNEQSSKKK